MIETNKILKRHVIFQNLNYTISLLIAHISHNTKYIFRCPWCCFTSFFTSWLLLTTKLHCIFIFFFFSSLPFPPQLSTTLFLFIHLLVEELEGEGGEEEYSPHYKIFSWCNAWKLWCLSLEEEGGGEGDDNKCCSGDALLKAWYILQMDWPIGYKKANYCIILEQFILLLLLYRYILLHMMINSSYALTVELIEICQWLFHNYVTH